MRVIGIDFGTTNSSAAICRGGAVQLIPLSDGGAILPSTLCVTKDHKIYFGRKAIEQYLLLTREMPIRRKFTDLRELTSVFQDHHAQDDLVRSENPLVVVSSVGADEELDMPARLFQALKTGLRDPSFNGTTIYGRYYATEELIALVLRNIRECAERYLGEPVEGAVIGHPVSYVPRDHSNSVTPQEINRTAHERMLSAARIAGFTHAALEAEPVAAARHLRRSLHSGSRALVFDFGGGTLDLALARITEDDTPQVIATHGIPLGGDDFDSAIMAHSLLKHFGQNTTLGDKHLPFPEHLLAPLLHWQTILLLLAPSSASQIAALQLQSNSPHTVRNLQTLVRQGLGFQLFQLIEAAKIALSDQMMATIAMHAKGLDIEEEVTRSAFVLAIKDNLAEIEGALWHIMDGVEVSDERGDAVLMTGGSSLVPVVQNLVRRCCRIERVQVADPFTSIAAGLGIIAAEDDVCVRVANVVAGATAARMAAEAITIGQRVTFRRGHQTVTGLVVRRSGGRLHDATLVIEFWDPEIEQFVSTMRHETKVTRLQD